MKVFVVVCHDRHCDDTVAVHMTAYGANVCVEAFKALYADCEYEWNETTSLPGFGSIRFIDTACGDGPTAAIREVEVLP